MNCPFCGKEITDNSVFCPECGQSLTNSKQSENVNEYWAKVQQENKKAETEHKEEIKKIEDEKKSKRHMFLVGLLICAIVVGIAVYVGVVAPANKYNNAISQYNSGNYAESKALFLELDDYKDSTEWVERCDQNLTQISYDIAVAIYEDGDYETAWNEFRALEGYQNSDYYLGECELVSASTAGVGDTVVLGHYGEDRQPIEWTVLEKNNSDILLISSYYVTSKVANGDPSLEYADDRDGHDYHCWSQSTLRTWLNGTFLRESFSDEQQNALITNHVVTDEYSVDDYDGWNEEEIIVSTEDKVYIPSKADIERYNLRPVSSMRNPDGSAIEGWLRDRGHGIAFQSTLDEEGYYGSEWHFYSSFGIRPIIRLSLDGVETVSVEEATAQDMLTQENNQEDDDSEIQVNLNIPGDALKVGTHSYYVYSNCSSWEEAESYCESLGGHLATIGSEEENSALFNYVRSEFGGNAYFGFSDNETEGNWRWITGESNGYTNWHSGEPNGESSREDYAMFYYKFDDGTWNDGDFNGSTVNGDKNFICEWDS